MSEWWTYALEDFLLFSPRTYYRLFELYNEAVWPLHILVLALGVAILVLLFRREGWAHRTISAILAVVWIFVAWAYLLDRYATINWAASYFAAAFVVESLLLIWAGLVRRDLVFDPLPSVIGRIGLGLFIFALIIQPALAALFGRPLAQAEMFAIAPDPTVIATLGLLLTATRTHWYLLLIPFAWCAISGLTHVAMHAPDAFVVIVAGCIAVILAAWKSLNRRAASPTATH
jgi:hypothetical protein